MKHKILMVYPLMPEKGGHVGMGSGVGGEGREEFDGQVPHHSLDLHLAGSLGEHKT
jgi:hypothetical protein